MAAKNRIETDYLTVANSIDDLLKRASQKGGFKKLSIAETKLLAKLSRIAESYEDQVLKIMPLTPLKQSGSNRSQIELLVTIRAKPLKYIDLISIAAKFDLNPTQVANLAGLSLRTFKSKRKSTKLSVNASEKIVRLGALYNLCLKVFDDNHSSLVSWLKTPIPALRMKAPNDLLTTHLGIDVVREELLRIEFSIY